MAFDKRILDDLENIKNSLSEYIIRVGLFGSILNKSINTVNDIDVLILYSGITFEELKRKIHQMKLNFPTYEAYLNVQYIPSGKTRNDPLGYHMILMPADHPNEPFLTRHENKISYYEKFN